jgi:hypothetical protein
MTRLLARPATALVAFTILLGQPHVAAAVTFAPDTGAGTPALEAAGLLSGPEAGPPGWRGTSASLLPAPPPPPRAVPAFSSIPPAHGADPLPTAAPAIVQLPLPGAFPLLLVALGGLALLGRRRPRAARLAEGEHGF